MKSKLVLIILGAAVVVKTNCRVFFSIFQGRQKYIRIVKKSNYIFYGNKILTFREKGEQGHYFTQQMCRIHEVGTFISAHIHKLNWSADELEKPAVTCVHSGNEQLFELPIWFSSVCLWNVRKMWKSSISKSKAKADIFKCVCPAVQNQPTRQN